MKFFAVILSLASLTTLTSALELEGKCEDNKDVKALQNFNVTEYAGAWHEVYRYEHAEEKDMDCVSATYALNGTNPINVHNMGVFNKTWHMVDGLATLVNASSTEAKLTVSIPSKNATYPYWVLSTDYKNYAVVYSCKDMDVVAPAKQNSSIVIWVLSRTTVLTTKSLMDAAETIGKAKLEFLELRATSHSADACNGASLQTLTLAVSLISALLIKLL